jgi:chromosome segregation ATPase
MQIPDTIDAANQLAQQNSVNSLLVLGFLALIVLMIVLIVFMYRIIKTLRPDMQAASAQASQETIVDLAQTITATSAQNANLLERMANTQDALVKMQGENHKMVEAFTELTRVTVKQQADITAVVRQVSDNLQATSDKFSIKHAEINGHFGELGKRMNTLDDKLDGNGKTIADILSKMDGLEKGVMDLRTAIRQPPTSTPAIENKLNEISADLVTIRDLLQKQTDEVPAVKPPEEKKPDA